MQGMAAEEFFDLSPVMSLVSQLTRLWNVIVTPT
jgi:hypothetical protein